MQLEKARYKIRCELGACKNFAAHTVRMERTGIKAALHVCDDCLRELHGLIGTMLAERYAGETDEKPKRTRKGGGKGGVNETGE